MPTSKTDIANMAAKHLGHSSPIQDLDTDRSAVAHACRTFYDRVRKLVLRDWDWPCATKIEALELIESDPTDQWDYSYQYPSDCLKFRMIQSDFRNDNRNTKIPFKYHNGNPKLIYTDRQNAIGEYTVNLTDPSQFDDDLVMAISWRLSVYIAPSITGGDPYKLKSDAWSAYQQELASAKENAAGEEVQEEDPLSEFEYARGG